LLHQAVCALRSRAAKLEFQLTTAQQTPPSKEDILPEPAAIQAALIIRGVDSALA
jgi:hypothetical protein